MCKCYHLEVFDKKEVLVIFCKREWVEVDLKEKEGVDKKELSEK